MATWTVTGGGSTGHSANAPTVKVYSEIVDFSEFTTAGTDVIEVIEGKIEAKGCSHKNVSCTGISGKCLNHDLWDELGKQIDLFLSHISLKDILEGNILGRSRAPIIAENCDKMTIN